MIENISDRIQRVELKLIRFGPIQLTITYREISPEKISSIMHEYLEIRREKNDYFDEFSMHGYLYANFLKNNNTGAFEFVYGEHLIDRSDEFSLVLFLDCFNSGEFQTLFYQIVFCLEEIAKEINRSLDS